ncbi:hypothetical protein L1987_47953 [Smallanthus sonchifolius]|uniref:Uncharacterized protein n=1 Tax=Smallanthus sonchifolius TaxID=185202 RepID=A0ACB9FRR1_9ASTR|nr:hypothetical protein L1987_47953 [Smallanthus sonchifolius]
MEHSFPFANSENEKEEIFVFPQKWEYVEDQIMRPPNNKENNNNPSGGHHETTQSWLQPNIVLSGPNEQPCGPGEETHNCSQPETVFDGQNMTLDRASEQPQTGSQPNTDSSRLDMPQSETSPHQENVLGPENNPIEQAEPEETTQSQPSPDNKEHGPNVNPPREKRNRFHQERREIDSAQSILMITMSSFPRL